MSKSINQVTLLGHVTKDPDLKFTSSQKAVCSFGLATNSSWKDQGGDKHEQTEFHNLVFWGKSAEIIAQYVNKGSKLLVQGRLQTDSWEKDGQKRYQTKVVVNDFVLLGGKKKEDAGVKQVKEALMSEPNDQEMEEFADLSEEVADEIPF